ncbi:hypothetical protein FHS18_004231 [Paenibacillus phyllosphaerae]|uniref:SAF domain-containing protein n=1 Tax=Paenibacillus phyllosphaerae TaxID=274593 RepID=A0A7W5FPD7_9BACL|nr:flagellar biosynthesis protein FlgA [Paenibacillus phyllosphaerae]MBB3112153.1 hypothetical protein [Paenibacillus phyllosphaerae]
MNRKRNIVIGLTAALLSAMLVYGIYVLQLRQVRFQETVTILVPNRFVSAGERITADMLDYKRIARGSYMTGMLMNAGDAVGLEAVIPLGQDEPLLAWKMDRYRLQPDRTQSTFQIPKDYVLSISSGIRAGDKVIVYVSGPNASSSRLFEAPAVVASVKSSANVEIDDPENPNLLSMASGDKESMYASRRNANGMIDTINLNLTEAQWLELDTLCKSGENKLVIAYSPASLDVGETESSP